MMEKERKGLTIASIVFLWIDILCLLGLTLFVIFVIRKIYPMYYDLGNKLPIITRITSSSHYIFIVLAMILIIKERLKKKLVTLLVNIAVCIILVLGVFPLLVWGTILPIRQISEVVKSAGISKEKAIEIAKEYAVKQGYDLKIYQEPTTAFNETNNTWNVFFETVDPIPGGHFRVIIDDKRREVLDFFRGK